MAFPARGFPENISMMRKTFGGICFRGGVIAEDTEQAMISADTARRKTAKKLKNFILTIYLGILYNKKVIFLGIFQSCTKQMQNDKMQTIESYSVQG
jgi:hypothetical protein